MRTNQHSVGLANKNKVEEFFNHHAPCLASYLPDQPADGMGYAFAPCGNVHNLSDLLSGGPNNCHSGKLCVS